MSTLHVRPESTSHAPAAAQLPPHATGRISTRSKPATTSGPPHCWAAAAEESASVRAAWHAAARTHCVRRWGSAVKLTKPVWFSAGQKHSSSSLSCAAVSSGSAARYCRLRVLCTSALTNLDRTTSPACSCSARAWHALTDPTRRSANPASTSYRAHSGNVATGSSALGPGTGFAQLLWARRSHVSGGVTGSSCCPG
eukprot:3311321-Rhodomonas_salina.3